MTLLVQSLCGALPAAVLLLGAAALAQDLSPLRSRFERETDPVRKARAFTALGAAQMRHLRQALRVENYELAAQVLEDYHKGVVTAHDGLKASGINAEKRPSGFKQLQIHVRQSLRELDNVILALPLREREPFDKVHAELEGIERELLRALFPRQPGRRDADGAKKP
jgi:hypothetical protein